MQPATPPSPISPYQDNNSPTLGKNYSWRVPPVVEVRRNDNVVFSASGSRLIIVFPVQAPGLPGQPITYRPFGVGMLDIPAGGSETMTVQSGAPNGDYVYLIYRVETDDLVYGGGNSRPKIRVVSAFLPVIKEPLNGAEEPAGTVRLRGEISVEGEKTRAIDADQYEWLIDPPALSPVENGPESAAQFASGKYRIVLRHVDSGTESAPVHIIVSEQSE